MIQKEFDSLLDYILNKLLPDTINVKGKEYSDDTEDVLSNLKEQAKMNFCSPKAQAFNLATKQLNCIRKYAQGTNNVDINLIEEKVKDSIIYCILYLALEVEEKETLPRNMPEPPLASLVWTAGDYTAGLVSSSLLSQKLDIIEEKEKACEVK